MRALVAALLRICLRSSSSDLGCSREFLLSNTTELVPEATFAVALRAKRNEDGRLHSHGSS